MNDFIHPLIKLRYSGRIIDPNKSIEPEKVNTLLEAARWAPSCANNQSWRFIVVQARSLNDVKQHLSRGNHWANNAPLIIVVASKPDLGCQLTGRDYFSLDLGLSIENMLLQGIHLGLVMHPIAGFEEEGVKSVLKIPVEFRVYALVIIGYPGTSTDVDERIIEKESAARERKPLSEIVFWEEWDKKSRTL